MGPTQPPVHWIPEFVSWRIKRQGLKLPTHLHLVLKTRLSGSIPPFSYTFLMCKAINSTLLHFDLYYNENFAQHVHILSQFNSLFSPKINYCNIHRHFFVIKPTRCTNFTNLFCHEILHVSDSSSVHHQEFIHCTLSNSVCHTGL